MIYTIYIFIYIWITKYNIFKYINYNVISWCICAQQQKETTQAVFKGTVSII